MGPQVLPLHITDLRLDTLLLIFITHLNKVLLAYARANRIETHRL